MTDGKEAFADASWPWYDELLRAAMRNTRDRQEAEDQVQETYVRAFKAWLTFDGKNIQAWLHRILTNVYLNEYRKNTPILQSFDAPQGEGDGDSRWETLDSDTPLDWFSTYRGQSAERLFLRSQVDERIRDAVAELPEEYQETFYLVDIEGYKRKEVAEMMTVPIGTVGSRLSRARDHLNSALAPIYGG